MTGSLDFEASPPVQLSRGARLILAILATLVLLFAVGVIEVGVLTAVSVVSSTHNHGGGQ